MTWQELADLPYAPALTPHDGRLEPDGEYDTAHFNHLTLGDPHAPNSHFLECAFTGVQVESGQLRRARFTDVWLRDVRLLGTGLAETAWTDVTLLDSAAAGVEAYGARMRRVVLRGCKMDSVNLREADLADVTFDGCVLRDVDFRGARLARTAFPRCTLVRSDFSRVRMTQVDLRGAELGITIDPESLRGAIVTARQLVDMAPVLADGLGITVADG